MPITKSGEDCAPAWCGLRYFEVVTLVKGEERVFARRGRQEKLIVGGGCCEIRCGDRVIAGEYKTNVDLTGADEHFAVRALDGPATVVWMCGDWMRETASGIFAVDGADGREDRGDAVDYPKETSFDSHYHDCDEYWIVFAGCGVAVSEGQSYEVEPGDCVATGMGFHHDFPQVHEPVRAVYFETELEGQCRKGHLWEHTHGAAVPRAERV